MQLHHDVYCGITVTTNLYAGVSHVLCRLYVIYYIRQVNGVNGEIYCDAFFLLSVCL